MANVPDIEISTRRLDTYQPRHIVPDNRGQDLQHVGRTVQWGGEQLDRIFEVQRRADEREGEFAVMQGVDFVKNGWNGYDTDDGNGGVKHVAGVVDWKYADLKAEETDPGKEMAKLSKAVREQEFYTNLSPSQKRVFERKWQFKQNEFNRAAHDHTQKLALAHKVEQDKAEIAWNGQRAGDKYGSKNVVVDPRTGAKVYEWEYTANWAGLRNFAIEQGTAITNPEILDDPNSRFEDLKWRGNISPEELANKRDRYQDQVSVFYVNRITALQQAGANNQPLGQYSAAECLDEADRMCEALKKNTRMRRGPNGEVVPMFNPEGLNAVKKETDKARHNRDMVVSKFQGDNFAKIDSDLDKVQWDMAYDLTQTGGSFDPSKAIGTPMMDENKFVTKVKELVDNEGISHEQGLKLISRMQKLRETRNQLFFDIQHPEQFAEKSDPYEWVRVKQMIADAERLGTPAEHIQTAVEGIKTKLTSHDYFSLWHDARKQRNSEDDRISNHVLSAYLGISENETATALDPKKRGSSASDDAISTLLGSSSAEYVMSGRWSNPDFEIADVDEAKKILVDYLDKHPGDMAGADRLLRDLVEPASREARARSFRDRIQKVRRFERSTGNMGIFSVQRAYGDEDGGGEIRPLPDDTPAAPGKAETRRPTRRHN